MSIKTSFTANVNKYWKVTTTKKVGSYGQTQLLGVVAKSAEEVVEKIDLLYPEVSITAITHVGAVDIPCYLTPL